MDAAQATKGIIAHNVHMIISTADSSGKPWVSPVFFTYDENYCLYWVSSKDARHSQNVRNRPQVAISIIGSPRPEDPFDGVYFDAEARELEDRAEILAAMKIHSQRRQADKFTIKTIDDVTGDAVWRMYKAPPKTIYKRGDAQINGQAITIRIKVEL